jgi:hypothetical protein
MKRLMTFVCGVASIMLYGCGPMQMPMPVRLDAEGQKNIRESWDKALTPIDHFDHSALLDVFLLTQAYQVGVDKLSFRSEKKVALGRVVMEIEYDQLKPKEDRFEVKILDSAGKVLREEKYNRGEVERANEDLFKRADDLHKLANNGGLNPEQTKELAALQARIDVVTAVFPKDEKKTPDEAAKKS